LEQNFNNRPNEQEGSQVNIQADSRSHADPAFPEPNAAPNAAPNVQQQTYQTYSNIPASQYQQMAPTPGKGKGTASLVLGILSILDPFIIFGVPLGIIGVVLAVMSKKEGHVSGVRTAGFVCSIIGIVLNALILIWFIFAIALMLGTGYYWDYFFDYLFYYL